MRARWTLWLWCVVTAGVSELWGWGRGFAEVFINGAYIRTMTTVTDRERHIWGLLCETTFRQHSCEWKCGFDSCADGLDEEITVRCLSISINESMLCVCVCVCVCVRVFSCHPLIDQTFTPFTFKAGGPFSHLCQVTQVESKNPDVPPG